MKNTTVRCPDQPLTRTLTIPGNIPLTQADDLADCLENTVVRSLLTSWPQRVWVLKFTGDDLPDSLSYAKGSYLFMQMSEPQATAMLCFEQREEAERYSDLWQGVDGMSLQATCLDLDCALQAACDLLPQAVDSLALVNGNLELIDIRWVRASNELPTTQQQTTTNRKTVVAGTVHPSSRLVEGGRE